MARSERTSWREPELWLGAFAVALAWVFLSLAIGSDMFGHAPHDSYTLMALAWRRGMLSLGQDYPWLELAVYHGDWYVSFPSVPALVMLPLTLIFGERTPDTLVTGLYLLGAYMAAYRLCRRFGRPASAMGTALAFALGCNLLDLSLTGDVWNQAQLLAFFLTTLAALGLTGQRRWQWAGGLFALALSVGCRPFQAVYVPFALWRLWTNLRGEGASAKAAVLRALPCLILPALVALALAGYNFARFGNPLEFGHNYLPEHTRDPSQPQMALKYIGQNVRNLLRLPWIEDGRLLFPKFSGFAFWMVNPFYVVTAVCAVLRLARRKWTVEDALLWVGFVLEIFLLLCHKTFGGWQFGARYLCDLLPMMLLFVLQAQPKRRTWERAIGLFGIAFNLYGSVIFHLMDKL